MAMLLLIFFAVSTELLLPVLGGGNAPPPAKPSLRFSASSYRFEEGVDEPSVTVLIDRPEGNTDAVSARLFAMDGTAANGLDYVFTSEVFEFPVGTNEQSVTFSVIDDDIVEGQKSFNFALSATGATLSSPSMVEVQIVDNDKLSVSDWRSESGCSGSCPNTFGKNDLTRTCLEPSGGAEPGFGCKGSQENETITCVPICKGCTKLTLHDDNGANLQVRHTSSLNTELALKGVKGKLKQTDGGRMGYYISVKGSDAMIVKKFCFKAKWVDEVMVVVMTHGLLYSKTFSNMDHRKKKVRKCLDRSFFNDARVTNLSLYLKPTANKEARVYGLKLNACKSNAPAITTLMPP